MKACSLRNKDIVQILLEHRADVNVTDAQGKTALLCAFDRHIPFDGGFQPEVPGQVQSEEGEGQVDLQAQSGSPCHFFGRAVAMGGLMVSCMCRRCCRRRGGPPSLTWTPPPHDLT